MTDERPERGAELRKRMSPEFARRERRRNLWAGLVGLGRALQSWCLVSTRYGPENGSNLVALGTHGQSRALWRS